MPKNQFLPFAVGDGANTLAAATYAAQGYLAQGFQNGVAQPYDINTILRQLSTVVSALGQFTADNQAADVLDDGVVSNFQSKFSAALKGALASSSVHFGIATGTGDAMVVTAVPPLMPANGGSYQAGSLLIMQTPASANTSTAPTINSNSIGNIAITRAGGSPLAAGDNPASTWIILFFDGAGCHRIGLTKSDVAAIAAQSVQIPSFGATDGVKVANGNFSLDFPGLSQLDAIAAAALFAYFDPASGHHKKTTAAALATYIISTIAAVTSANVFPNVVNVTGQYNVFTRAILSNLYNVSEGVVTVTCGSAGYVDFTLPYSYPDEKFTVLCMDTNGAGSTSGGPGIMITGVPLNGGTFRIYPRIPSTGAAYVGNLTFKYIAAGHSSL